MTLLSPSILLSLLGLTADPVASGVVLFNRLCTMYTAAMPTSTNVLLQSAAAWRTIGLQ